MTRIHAAAAGVLASLVLSACLAPKLVPITSHERVVGTHGFSFLPPRGYDWLEELSTNRMLYRKLTDPKSVSFFVGAIDGKLRGPAETEKDLVGVVRIFKAWNDDERYTDKNVSYWVEVDNNHCIRYESTAHDHQASNKGSHPFLVLLSVGRFCVHPVNRIEIVDIFYSIRRTPDFDQKAFVAQGEDFLRGLGFPSK